MNPGRCKALVAVAAAAMLSADCTFYDHGNSYYHNDDTELRRFLKRKRKGKDRHGGGKSKPKNR